MTEPARLESLEILKRLPLFADLGGSDLQRLTSLAEKTEIPAGTVLFEEGTKGDRFYVIVRGEVEVTRSAGGRAVVLAILGPGGFLSEMSLLEARPRTASARAVTDAEVISIRPAEFRELLERSPHASLTMLKTVTARLRSTEASLVEQGRLAGLGTLAAGLAHELNNPATAVLRSSGLLQESLARFGERGAELRSLPLGSSEADFVRHMEDASFRNPAAGSRDPSSPLHLEEEVEEWLEELGVADPWAAAPPLVEAGWDQASLEEVTINASPSRLPILLGWMAAGAETQDLVQDIQRGARAVAGIVDSVRSYSHLDRGPVQLVDVAESIEDTLVILKGKLGDGITVIRDLPPALPAIEACGSELSQVWTNLIDNAIDAMEGSGTLGIRGATSEGGIVVEIEDTGPGIAPGIRPRIFDPFFTTKPEGSGTGLGLAITHGIVVNRHRGAIRVDSRPGRTVFEVALPLRLGGGKAETAGIATAPPWSPPPGKRAPASRTP